MKEMPLEKALTLTELIHSVVRSPYNTDKEAMEEIVKIFEMYGIRCGARSNKTPKYYILTDE